MGKLKDNWREKLLLFPLSTRKQLDTKDKIDSKQFVNEDLRWIEVGLNWVEFVHSVITLVNKK